MASVERIHYLTTLRDYSLRKYNYLKLNFSILLVDFFRPA